ncbi:hypothetical protein KJ854_00655 [Patescibacteria group bacterium]|nr:hypothetical protein [Patescibacteria group bacterium]
MLRNYLKHSFPFFRRLDKKVIASAAIAFLFLFFFASADATKGATIAEQQAALDDKKAQLEEQIANLRKEIENLKTDIGQKESEKKTVTREVNLLTSKINALKLEINSTEIEIEKIGYDIKSTEEKILANEQNLAKQKEFLGELIRSIYISQDKSLVEVLLGYDQLSDFLSEFQRLEKINDNAKNTIESIKLAKQELEKDKGNLLSAQEEKNNLLALRENQKQDVQVNKNQKQQILNLTVKEQKALQAELSKGEKLLPAMIAQLRSLQIAGQVINADTAIAAAKFVSTITGVRAAYLLGILKVETNLGSNLGSGYYKTDMSPKQQPTFLDIITELGLPDTVPVSKKPKSYTGWGGAMGPAQMMPTTWIGYKDRVSAITGNNPPNPWNITDAVTAMALYVLNVPGVASHDYNAEYEAAARYFAGSNWQKYTWYAKNSSRTGVMDWAVEYEKLLGGG